jgi:tRNASer (uridine44-2'-O)-methyltransferase
MLNLGADGHTSSSYAAYRIWLASLSMHCGWVVESETLRIPSTRNWAIIGIHMHRVFDPVINLSLGRQRSEEESAITDQKIEAILEVVRQRDVFRTRRPEGKANEH